jgi:hypothetical protein
VRDACEKSLYRFVEESFHTIEGVPFKPGRHLQMVCEHLEHASNRQLPRLLINLPPRHCKNLIANVFWPAWTWAFPTELDEIGRRRAINDETWLGPGVRFLCIANKESLASDHSTSCRRVIESEWYQSLWGDRYQLQPDQNGTCQRL